jgi:hypothetical protein
VAPVPEVVPATHDTVADRAGGAVASLPEGYAKYELGHLAASLTKTLATKQDNDDKAGYARRSLERLAQAMKGDPAQLAQVQAVAEQLGFPKPTGVAPPPLDKATVARIDDAMRRAKLNLTTDDAGRRYIKTSDASTGNVTLTKLDDYTDAGIARAIKEHKDTVKHRDRESRARRRVEREDS